MLTNNKIITISLSVGIDSNISNLCWLCGIEMHLKYVLLQWKMFSFQITGEKAFENDAGELGTSRGRGRNSHF